MHEVTFSILHLIVLEAIKIPIHGRMVEQAMYIHTGEG